MRTVQLSRLMIPWLARMKSGKQAICLFTLFATDRGVLASAIIALLIVLQCSATDAIAGPREDAAAAMTRCDTLVDNKAWLDCHDAATAQMRAAIQSVPSGSVARPQAHRNRSNDGFFGGLFGHSEAGPPQQFGQEDLRPARANQASRGQAKSLSARVVSISFSPTGYFTVELENGQTWRQVDGDTNYARFRSPVSRNIVNIEHGFLRSYNLHIQGKSEGYKVRLIK